MRFIKQRDSYGCGPVAIYNTLLYFDLKPNLRKLYKDTKADIDIGTWIHDVDKVLRKQKGLKVRKILRPTVNHFDLKDGSIALVKFNYRRKKYKRWTGGHYIVVLGSTKKMYYSVNEFRKGRALRKSMKTSMKKCFKTPNWRGDISPKIWIISRRA